MKDMTLVFFEEDDNLLLAMKKRGFGADRWNGVGGKLEPGETLDQALVRESQEEIGVTPIKYRKVAELQFRAFMKDKWTDLLVHAYICSKWSGKPVETEEMRPQWFAKSDIPYDRMWQDDPFWLPRVLEGPVGKRQLYLRQARQHAYP